MVLKGAAEKVKAYEAGDKKVLTEKSYKELKTAMGDHDAHVLEFKRGQIADLLEPAGPNHFNVAKGSLGRVMDHYTNVEKDVKVQQVGDADPVTGARTIEIKPKEGAAWRVTERVSAKEGGADKSVDGSGGGPAASKGKPRVTAPVEGLYGGVKTEPKVADWQIRDQLQTTPDGKKVIKTFIDTPDGKSGWVERAYDPATKSLEMRNAFLEDLPKWVNEGGPNLDAAKGTPTVTYLTIRQMKLLGIDYGGLKKVKMSTIQNVRAVIEFNAQLKTGVAPDAAVMNTHSVQYADTTIVQSGSKVAGAKVGGDIWKTPLKVMMEHYETGGGSHPPDPATVAKHDLLIAEHGKGQITRDTVVEWNYDIELTLAPSGK